MAILEPTSVNCVIYHADCTDGFGAAYSAWKCLGNRAEYHACKHGSTPPDVKGKVVAILDFSYNNATTKQMIEDADNLIVIDHHKSAMVELHDISNTHFDMKHSGARLAWDFFHPGKEAPKFIDYIEDRDLWKWELPYSKEFSAAFDMVPFDFEEFEKREVPERLYDRLEGAVAGVRGDLARGLRNGLSEKENERLMGTESLTEILALLRRGLGKVFA